MTHTVGALTSDYGVLFATRVVGAFVYAGFWAVAAATTVSLVPATARGKAMGIVAVGQGRSRAAAPAKERTKVAV
ncbi:hypothetical protein GCM10022254_03680 [Actinomadura meridiana]|uniref:MFS transporter n=1 Tax=Actinomadura meridiana TaxID=559626 RepID=A0ABP8BS28_9ACTN